MMMMMQTMAMKTCENFPHYYEIKNKYHKHCKLNELRFQCELKGTKEISRGKKRFIFMFFKIH